MGTGRGHELEAVNVGLFPLLSNYQARVRSPKDQSQSRKDLKG